jgi:hypothetical protein
VCLNHYIAKLLIRKHQINTINNKNKTRPVVIKKKKTIKVEMECTSIMNKRARRKMKENHNVK